MRFSKIKKLSNEVFKRLTAIKRSTLAIMRRRVMQDG